MEGAREVDQRVGREATESVEDRVGGDTPGAQPVRTLGGLVFRRRRSTDAASADGEARCGDDAEPEERE